MLAQLCALVSNQWKGKEATRAKPADFMPSMIRLKGEEEEQSRERMIALAKAMTIAMGGTVQIVTPG